ncbi:SCO7613 C-terminal domain-containing membrane protein [Microbacterium sp. HJ5]
MNALATTRVPAWSRAALAGLRDTASCPLCGAALGGQTCERCGADYREIGGELWDASHAAIEALEARQGVLDRVAQRPAPADALPPTAPVPPASIGPVPAPAAAPRASATVQSVLAVAGAGLVAVAAVVFTFFNPDLTDGTIRGLLVGAVTAVFLVGAAALARRGLQFSAEAVGALGLVFLGLDIQALTGISPREPWAVAAGATFGVAALLGVWALRRRIRVWLWGALVALALVPAMAGYAIGLPVVGHLGVALAAFGLIATTGLLDRWWGEPLRAERATLTVVQLVAVGVALIQGWVFGAFPPPYALMALCICLVVSAALSLVSTRHPAGGLWSFLAGAAGTAAAAVVPALLVPDADLGDGAVAVVPAAAMAGAIFWALLVPAPGAVRRGLLCAGALAVVGVTAIAPVASAMLIGAATLLTGAALASTDTAVATTLGLASVAIGLPAFALLRERLHPIRVEADRPAPLGTLWVGHLGLWFGVLSTLTLPCIPGLALWARVALGLVLGSAAALAVSFTPRVRRSSISVRVPFVIGAHLLAVLSTVLSWHGGLELAALAGPAVVAAVAVLARSVPARARFLHVAVGYAYALVVLAALLFLQGVEGVALVCLTTSAGAVAAVVATFVPRVSAQAWQAILVVTSVPFVVGVAQVVFERSGWTALSTALIFLLALTLVHTKRAGLVLPVRLAAAAILVPSLAVVVVCLGAQLLVASGSPVVLPLIALIVAVVLPCGPLVRAALAPRIGERDAALVRIAIEASTLVTSGIAVMLSLVRDAAGLSTALTVLVILGVGGVATALRGGRRYGWWLAAASFTGALWCAWGIAGVVAVEPYLLPPALGAAVVGAALTARGLPGVRLYTAGLLAAVVPLVVLLAVSGSPVRAVAFVAASWVLVLVGAVLGRGSGVVASALRPLRSVTFAMAIAAGAAGAVEAVRLGLGRDPAPEGVLLVFACLALGIAGAVPAALAARGIRSGAVDGSRVHDSRWLLAPALAYVSVAAWPAIERDWTTIWTLWALMMCLLAFLVAVARVGLRRPTGLPPVWFVFGLAFVTAVVAWSPRDLRVEWFSLPLGAALLVAGALAMKPEATDAAPRAIRPGRLSDWSAGWTGSWALLAPGIVVTLSASIAATFTDPLTWRAILVIVLALAAILVGASRRLAAPFLIGIVVLPVENVLAFAVQIGRGIESMPWWVTLAVVGAVLLIIAVTYERRAGEESGIAARLRDLA